jgi:hypothetical protein
LQPKFVQTQNSMTVLLFIRGNLDQKLNYSEKEFNRTRKTAMMKIVEGELSGEEEKVRVQMMGATGEHEKESITVMMPVKADIRTGVRAQKTCVLALVR